MKFAAQTLLLVSLALTFAHAQTNNLQQVQHVIIVIQENRTPDNLFNQNSTLVANGGHVQGASGNNQGLDKCVNGSTPLQSTSFYTCWDLDHSHAVSGEPSHGAWKKTWDSGAMDGACDVSVFYKKVSGNDYCNSTAPLCLTSGTDSTNTCPYAYACGNS
jgi:phospholipase C